MMSKLCVFVVIFSVFLKSTFSVDTTLSSGASGKAVVIACIEKIEESGIFTDDHDILKHLAYKESLYVGGSEPGGIWKFPFTKFNDIQSGTIDVSSYYASITTHFSIDPATIAYEELLKPLYSAIFARLIIAHAEATTTTAVPTALLEQGVWWAVYYSDAANPAASEFVSTVTPEFEVCLSAYRDVIFLVDASTDTDGLFISSAKSFVTQVVNGLDYDNNNLTMQIGIAMFSDQLQVIRYLGTVSTYQDVVTATNEVVLLGNQRFTGESVSGAIGNMFTEVQGSRVNSSIPQVLVLISSGKSDDDVTRLAEFALENKITIIAYALSTDADLDELEIITGSSDLVFSQASLGTAESILVSIDKICDAAYTTSRDHFALFSGSLSVDRPLYMDLPMFIGLNTLYAKTSSGEATCYMTTNSRTPSEANHDEQWTITETQDTMEYTGSANDTFSFVITTTSTTEIAVFITNAESATVTSSPAGSSELSDGSIAAIVVIIVILFGALIFAFVYYRYCKPKPTGIERQPLQSLNSIQGPSRLSGISGVTTTTEVNNRQSEQELRHKLATAIYYKNIPELERCVAEFKQLQLEDTDRDLLKAEIILKTHSCKQGLNKAIAMRSMKILEQRLYHAKKLDFGEDEEFTKTIKIAENLLADLKMTDILLRRLMDAIEMEEDDLIQEITDELLQLNNCDRETIDKMLLTYRHKKILESAITLRKREPLVTAIDNVVNLGLAKNLQSELKTAKKVLRDLDYLDKVLEDVMNLKQSSVSEIRSYGRPPPGVHEVMTAVYLLLSYKPSQLEKWTDIQALMGQTGKFSLRRLISTLMIRDIPSDNVEMAKNLLSQFRKENIAEISEGLGVFFAYACTAVTEYENCMNDPMYLSRLNTPVNPSLPRSSATPAGGMRLHVPGNQSAYLVR